MVRNSMEDVSIRVNNVSKKFRIYHEQNDTIFSELVNLGEKKYEDIKVLDDVSFEVRKGEILGVIGRNGSGKTTLLRIISRILSPDSGNVFVNGTITPILQLGAGFNSELSAKENIILSGLFMGMKKNEIKNKIAEILEFAEVTKFADTKLKYFSSGMYAKLAFAVSIQSQPDIILIDEALSVGDINFQRKGFSVFEEYKRKNKSIVLVSHDLSTISSLCDKVICLEKGKIIAEGEPDIVIHKYLKYSGKE